MNRFLSVLPLLGALTGTAAAAPYVLPYPQPGALTPYDWQPVYAIEGLYSIADKHELPDSWGLRGSFNLYNAGTGTWRHQFNINVAASWGQDDVQLADLLPTTAARLSEHRTDMDLFLLPVTLGYNFNFELLDSLMLYLGGKAGFAWSHSKIKIKGKEAGGREEVLSHSQSDGGFTFSVGGGLKLQCSQAIYVHAGYEFGRSYLNDAMEGRDFIYGTHTIFLGVGTQF